MSHRKKLSISTFFVFTFFILLLNTNIFSLWYANYTDVSYGGDGEISTSTAMSGLISEGCGYFLESRANTLLFMKKIEWSGKTATGFDELNNLLSRSLDNMISANETYVNLKQAADAAPYNPAVIQVLKTFDYDGFKEANSLNKDIFKEVKYYLSNGDIRGAYARILADTEKLVMLLRRIKGQIEAGDFPVIKDVWELDQTFSQSLLFGQYLSRVFYRLTMDGIR